MADFLIGCTHFGHENIIRLANRPFSSVQEMDDEMIRRWNDAVGKKDTVYHLGDFAFRGAPGGDYLRRLNGRVVTLRGNHDPNLWGVDYLTVKVNKTRAVLFHYPIEEWDGWYRGAVHFHAHTHSPNFVSGIRRGNVGADAINFTPIRLDFAVDRILRESQP